VQWCRLAKNNEVNMAPFARTTLLRLSALSALFSFAQTAAADGGVYLMASYGGTLSSYGRSEIDDAANIELDGAATITASEASKNKPIWSAAVGYLFESGVGIEASYLDLGKLRYRGSGSGTASSTIDNVLIDFESRSRGPALAFTWNLPMGNQWGLGARVGAYRVKSSTDYTVTLDEDIEVGTQSATSTSLLAGVGASFTVSPHMILRLDYLYLDKVREKLVEGDFDANLVTAGFAYVF
jgi:opacity protein-like surface antigen